MNISTSESTSEIKLNPSWLKHLDAEFKSEYMINLKSFLKEEIKKKKTIFPKGPNYFEALNRTGFDKVKVVILGQDPYHGEGQAHGLSFSVPMGVRPPPSLLNILKEIRSDLKKEPSVKDDLSSWADQGVLLLNSVLTVEMGKPASHAGRGWEAFTDKIIHLLNDKREHLVFILWGSYAQKKGAFIDRKKHFVIESVHPSPLSAHRGFMGSRPFSKANEYLKKTGQTEINW
ncbi:MAG: uracil-DNA glycosylase [Bdellovibrionaceae bacterium]|jgi:uracil-DNA glycosylase|nr:uracil-DNA glycosylase [Pseudobdellovibrionaceae bacterium]